MVEPTQSQRAADALPSESTRSACFRKRPSRREAARCSYRVLLAVVVTALVSGPGCTADFELLGDADTSLELDEVDESPDLDVESDELAEETEADSADDVEEIADTREQRPAAATCPAETEAPADACWLALVEEPFVPSQATPVYEWKLSEIGANQYNGLWIDLDVYHDGWRAPGDLDRHNLFKAQVAPIGATTLPDAKVIGAGNASPPDWICLEQGFSATKPLTKLEQAIEPGYWYHVRYVYFPANERQAQMEITRDGVSILHNPDDFLQAADVARMRVTSGEEVVLTLGFPATHPVGVVTTGWEYRNVRVVTFACGDGFVDASEDCDPGTALDSAGCDSDCTAVVCGDNHLNAAVETCDDGNTNDGDGCPGDCTSP